MVENEWLCPTYGEFGTQRKVMWNCTICLSCGSAMLYFKYFATSNAAALLLFFCYVGGNDLSIWSHFGEGELIWINC